LLVDAGREAGPLAFLSWTCPLLAGSILYDILDVIKNSIIFSCNLNANPNSDIE